MLVMVPLNRRKTVISAALTAVFVLVSCSARQPIAPASVPFRLESVSGDSVLLTPPVPEGKDEYASIKLVLKSSPAPPGHHCFAERGHFRVEQEKNEPNSVHITMPSPATWLSDLEGRLGSSGDSGIEALFTILADLDKLREAGCFPDTKLSIRDFILQSLPMKPTDSLFNYYGYLADRSGLDLTPGMRLKTERAYFRPAEVGEEEHSAKLFLGLSTAYFNLQLASNGKIPFHRNVTFAYFSTHISYPKSTHVRRPSLEQLIPASWINWTKNFAPTLTRIAKMPPQPTERSVLGFQGSLHLLRRSR